MRFTHLLALIAVIATTITALPQPVYTVHYVRSYRNDLSQGYFGCGKSITYGVYLYPMGPVDALYALMNPHIYGGFPSNCQRISTYVKLFGDAQNFEKLMDPSQQVLNTISQTLSRVPTKNVIIDWKYLPNGDLRQRARRSLQFIAQGLMSRGYTVFIKAPASYFCAIVGTKRFILDQPVGSFIMELYGEQPGQYTTYENIFGETAAIVDGYSPQCPKYPTRPILNRQAPSKTIHFQKTLDSTQPGYIGPNWQKFLQRVGQSQSKNIFFYDGFPQQTVDF